MFDVNIINTLHTFLKEHVDQNRINRKSVHKNVIRGSGGVEPFVTVASDTYAQERTEIKGGSESTFNVTVVVWGSDKSDSNDEVRANAIESLDHASDNIIHVLYSSQFQKALRSHVAETSRIGSISKTSSTLSHGDKTYNVRIISVNILIHIPIFNEI